LSILGIDKVSGFTLILSNSIFCPQWNRKCHYIWTFTESWLCLKQDKVEDCSKFLMEFALRDHFKLLSNKRKFCSLPGSPSGVVDVSFSSDSSNDSWSVASSVSSSPKPLSKKSRALQSLNNATTSDFSQHSSLVP
jgi:cyclin D3